MNTNITKAAETTTAAEVTTKATTTTAEATTDKKYHISGPIEAAEAKLADAKAALDAAQRELELAKLNNEFELLMMWLTNANPTTFIDAVRYAIDNCNEFPDYVPFDCPNADDAYCGAIVEASKKAGKEIQGDLFLTLVRKREISSYELDLCVKAWEDIRNS